MIKLTDLTGITKPKIEEIAQCLNDLLTFRDYAGNLAPIISGYNWYTTSSNCDSIITFSNIHETEPYKDAMLNDLKKWGYDSDFLNSQMRQKFSALLWDPAYRIRDDKGDLLRLKIKDLAREEYLKLENYGQTLIGYAKFLGSKSNLLAEGEGWEIDIPFNNKVELLEVVNLFLRKASIYVYNKEGIEIQETDKERLLRSPWPDAYKTPVLIIGKGALEYHKELPHFDVATKMILVEDNNEISFIIHKHFELLKDLTQYKDLQRLGFTEEKCLGNTPFLNDIDRIR